MRNTLTSSFLFHVDNKIYHLVFLIILPPNVADISIQKKKKWESICLLLSDEQFEKESEDNSKQKTLTLEYAVDEFLHFIVKNCLKEFRRKANSIDII